jgi:hypothetical protein
VSEAKVFIIFGNTGEYSDRYEWPVAVVETEDAAKKYVAALDKQYLSIPAQWHDDWPADRDDEMAAIMSLDPNFSCDYTGTTYHYKAAPFYKYVEGVIHVALTALAAGTASEQKSDMPRDDDTEKSAQPIEPQDS